MNNTTILVGVLASALLCSGYTYNEKPIARTDVLNLELKKLPFQRDYLFPGETEWEYEVSLNLRSNVWRFYIESDITGQTRGSRFRNMWWDYTLGLHLFPAIDVVWDHRSQHKLDAASERFPVRDSYGIRINLLQGE